MAKFGIAMTNTGIGFLMVKNMVDDDSAEEYYYMILPLITIFTFSLILSSILFTAFETTQITLL